MIHAIRILASDSHITKERAWDNRLKASFGERLPDQAVPPTRRNDGERIVHLETVRRVPAAQSIRTVVDAVEAELADREWYQIWTHICRNDENLPCEPWVLARHKNAPTVESLLKEGISGPDAGANTN